MRVAVQEISPLSMMMTVLERGIVFDVGRLRELLVLIKSLRLVS